MTSLNKKKKSTQYLIIKEILDTVEDHMLMIKIHIPVIQMYCSFKEKIIQHSTENLILASFRINTIWIN